MRTRDKKLIKFIMEFSQVLLVFFGVFSAIMCTATSLELPCDRYLIALIMLVASIVFYGLFTVLETFRKGKGYGILGITLFFALIGLRFMGAMQKGFVTAVNGFLKEFMNYTGTTLSLLTYSDLENSNSSVKFGTNLLLILVGVYLIAIVSAFFYRRRRSKVFMIATLPFVILPLVIGKVGNFGNMFTYLIVAMTIIGTRHLRTDATDRRMRQKLAIVLMLLGLVCGGISYALVPPQRYDDNMDKLLQAKNSVVALSSWTTDDVFAWLKAYFNGDTITYGRLGTKKEIAYTGETILKVSGDVYSDRGIYLKGYVGDNYEDSRWSSIASEDEYKKDLEELDSTGVTIENWHAQLRNELGEDERSGETNAWKTGVLRIRNLAFGYGNYLVPYLPTAPFKQGENGRSLVEQPGIDYAVEYYWRYPYILRQAVLQDNYRLASETFWNSNKAERQRLKDFADKYYLQIPENLAPICEEFKAYLKERNLWSEVDTSSVSLNDQSLSKNNGKIIDAVKTYIMQDTSYSLSPGKTPSGQDTVEYFLKESKKGYCTYYATTAAILLRSVGIPTRYIEGVHISKDELLEGAKTNKEIDVPDEDAHAWIEVYDEKYGFVPVEVTPGRGDDDTVSTGTSGTTDSNGDDTTPKDNPQDNQDDITEEPEIATPTPLVTEKPEESMTFDDIDGNEEPSDGGNQENQEQEQPFLSGIWWIILNIVIILGAFLAAMEIQRRIRKRLFIRTMRSNNIKRRIRIAYHHLLPIFVARSVIYRGQSMAEYTSQIAEAVSLPESDIAVFVALLYHARFGPDDIGEEELRAFGGAYNLIRDKIYEDVKFIKKLYYMYIMVL